MKPFRIVRLTVILGSYNFGNNAYGETMSREEAERTAEDMQGKVVSGEFLGLPKELQYPLGGRYTLVRIYLYNVPNNNKGAGLLLAECEGDKGIDLLM